MPNVDEGRDATRLVPHRRARRGIALVRQVRELADRYVVLQRGEVLQSGEGRNMDADGVRGLLAV
jgi:ABC-type branched-subunit amino acid transport system ATPase component